MGNDIARAIARRLTRRAVLKRTISAGLGLPIAGSILSACDASLRNADGSETPEINQNKQQRAGTGLRGNNPDKAFPGYTLFTPLSSTTAYLIDMEGHVEHTWELPYPPGLSGYLTPEGTLIYNAQVPRDEVNPFLGAMPFRGGAMLEADWDGNVLWELKQPDHHHDGIRLRNGNLMFLCLSQIPDELAAKVQGGRPGTEWNGHMHADYLVELTPDGEEVWRWNAWEHLDPEEDGIVAIQDQRGEWTHGNAITELADGNILVSFRSPSIVAIVDRQSGEIIWKLGAPPLAQQHAPVELENGNILLFDNGTHRLDHHTPYSRVLEVERESQEIVWTYQAPRIIDFYSPFISNAQRLPNGNTLICEGNFGRFFEVTDEGEVVWEYVSPYFNPIPEGTEGVISNQAFRCYRYSEEQIEAARTRRG